MSDDPLSEFPALRAGDGHEPGRRRRFVHRLHRLLRTDGYMTPAHGRFTGLTEAAVLAFQARHQAEHPELPISGEVGAATWKRLLAETNPSSSPSANLDDTDAP